MTTAFAFLLLFLFYLLLVLFWGLNFIAIPENWLMVGASAIWILLI